jgi:hypothetical protein
MAEPRRPIVADFTNKYTTEMLVYPPTLAWLQEHQHYVAFYINVPESSFAAAGDYDDVEPLPGGITTNKDGLVTSQNYKRLKTAIVLPIMEAPSVRYSADWDATALGPVVGYMMTNGGGGGNAFMDMGDLGGLLGDAVKSIGLASLNTFLPDSADGNTSRADIFSAIKRAAINDHRTQLFRNMRFRDFQFQYKLTARNQKEMATIKNIVNKFKFHMHPDTAKGNIFLTYPSEFDIVFYFKNIENAGSQSSTYDTQNLFKISTCALTDCQVDYGDGAFATFTDGAPIEVNLKLSFLELELLTKERIAEGF